MKYKESEELQLVLREWWQSLSPVRICLVLRKFVVTLLLLYKAATPGRTMTKNLKKVLNLAPKRCKVPFWYDCSSGWMITFNLYQFKQIQLNKPVSEYSETPGKIFGHQPRISFWLLELCCCSGQKLEIFRYFSGRHLWTVVQYELWRGWVWITASLWGVMTRRTGLRTPEVETNIFLGPALRSAHRCASKPPHFSKQGGFIKTVCWERLPLWFNVWPVTWDGFCLIY